MTQELHNRLAQVETIQAVHSEKLEQHGGLFSEFKELLSKLSDNVNKNNILLESQISQNRTIFKVAGFLIGIGGLIVGALQLFT